MLGDADMNHCGCIEGCCRILAELVERARGDAHGAGTVAEQESAREFFRDHPTIPLVPVGYVRETELCRESGLTVASVRRVTTAYDIPQREYCGVRYYHADSFGKAVRRRDRAQVVETIGHAMPTLRGIARGGLTR